MGRQGAAEESPVRRWLGRGSSHQGALLPHEVTGLPRIHPCRVASLYRVTCVKAEVLRSVPTYMSPRR